MRLATFSCFHRLARSILRIYLEKDKRRAKELGVSPGGDIMIHGIKKGLSWVGAFHAKVDWTNGCTVLADEEVEEIYKFVPNGTIVEIKP